MKLTVVAVTLFGLAHAAPTPRPAWEKLAWRETHWAIAVKLSPAELAQQPEEIQGTWLYCSRFDGPPERQPEGEYGSSEHCRDMHYKAAWVPADPFGPCESGTGYLLENCGTIAYCKQYDMEGDQPRPSLFDDANQCLEFYESGPTAKRA